MSQRSAVAEVSDEMEALFDSIVSSNAGCAATELAPVAGRSLAPGAPEPAAANSEPAPGGVDVISRVGHLTRTLHESLRGLGYDTVIEKTAAAIPDARDRLAYVTTMTEQAACRTLNATDAIKPIQDALGKGAGGLSTQWDRLFARELDVTQFKQLVADTRGYLADVPEQTGMANAQLMEIMMAQDFQDLTGQVIRKATEIIQMVERELLQLLLDNVPIERKTESDAGLLNGPVVKPEGRSDVMSSQSQVDELLESLGF